MQIKYNDKLRPEEKVRINNFKSYLSKPKPVIKNNPILEPKIEPEQHVHLHDIMTPSEVADYLSISEMTLKRWGKKGRLNCIRINSRGDRRYLRSEIERLIGG